MDGLMDYHHLEQCFKNNEWNSPKDFFTYHSEKLKRTMCTRK